MLGLILCCHHVDVLRNLIFELGFYEEVWLDNGAFEQRIHSMSVLSHSLLPWLHIVFIMPYEHKILEDPGSTGVQWDSKQVWGNCVTSMTESNGCGGCWQPQVASFLLKCKLPSNAEWKWWCFKKHKAPRNPIVFLPVHVTSLVTNSLCWKWLAKRKGEDGAIRSCFFILSFLTHK